VSTCGITPAIYQLEKAGLKTELAISVTAADEAKRRELFPFARQYPLKKIVAAAGDYAASIRRPVTFEYVLFKGINDSRRDAQLLGQLIRKVPCKVNLIRYNAVRPFRFEASSETRAAEFGEWLRPFCRAVTLRLSKGDEIDAACGQLSAGYGDGGTSESTPKEPH
jgi:23S rRNA (adenine2503-C2)-methyltransferase